ncbi:MAG: hypothetical protein ABH832_02115 [bacterium]
MPEGLNIEHFSQPEFESHEEYNKSNEISEGLDRASGELENLTIELEAEIPDGFDDEVTGFHKKLAELNYQLAELKGQYDVGTTPEKEKSLGIAQKLENTWSEILEKEKNIDTSVEFPRAGFLAGKSEIENQEVHMTKKASGMEVSFFLSENIYEDVINRIKEDANTDWIKIQLADDPNQFLKVKRAYSLDHDGAQVLVAKKVDVITRTLSKAVPNAMVAGQCGFGATHSLDRMVVINFSQEDENTNGAPDFSKIAASMEDIMTKLCGRENVLDDPDTEEAEDLMKKALSKHLKKEVDEITDDDLDGLSRREVYDGVYSYVKEGRGKKINQESPCAIYHRVRGGSCKEESREDICNILVGGGLMSTTERLARGKMEVADGMSSFKDMWMGGGSYVFGRMVTEDGLKGKDVSFKGYHVVLDPNILDRNDWHAYDSDKFGTTDPKWYNDRPSPDEYVSSMNKKFKAGNEICFRSGVPPSEILGVTCSSEKEKQNLVTDLQKRGISEVNGVPVEEFVKVGKLQDMINLSKKE